MTSKYFVFIIMAIIFVAGFSILRAATLEVPGTYATIQAGIDAASNGDTVNVAAGSYTGPGNTDINTGGKAILVKGAIDSTSCGKFIFNSEEDTTTVIKGFNIGNYFGPSGSHISIVSSSPKIEYCNFMYGNSFEGGAIVIAGGSPIIRHCSFTFCVANKGGAICILGGSLTLEQSFFHECRAQDTSTFQGNYPGQGGAIYSSYSELTISHCSFNQNKAGSGMQNAHGGAIYSEHSTAIIDTSVFAYNEAYRGFGGAVYSTLSSSIEFTNITFLDNWAIGAGNSFYQNGASSAGFTACLCWNNMGSDIYSCDVLSDIQFTCCNFDSAAWNTAGCIADWQDTLGNMSVEPHYCSVINLSHDPDSPCLPDNNDCGVRVGAIGETGDINLSGSINILDIIDLIDYVFKYDPFDAPPVSVFYLARNVDCEEALNILDIICLINHKFYGSCDLCDCD